MKPEKEYFEHLAAGRFMLQRSRSTGKYVFYPRVAAPATGETDLEWVAASGKGTVYATTVIRKKPPQPSYNIALIDLDEGVRMMARVEGIMPEDVSIGTRVEGRVIQPEPETEDVPMVIFRPA